MIDWSKMLSPYENKWVAISEDEKSVLASGKTLKAVISAVASQKVKARYTYVHGFEGVFAP